MFVGLLKMILYDTIKLLPDGLEITIQVKRSYTDFITAHVINVVWGNLFVCFGVEQHSRYRVLSSSELYLFVFYVGKYLIEVRGM